MTNFKIDEKHLSQIPALQLLINLGFEFLTPKEALIQRQNKKSNVLLENILGNQLKAINSISYNKSQYPFSEENIKAAIKKLRDIRYDGLIKTNEAVYDLITLGTAMKQTIEGRSKSFDLKYIDWDNLTRNKFHVTAEYSVERSGMTTTVRPDIVLFVNGIPFCVIECKSPQIDIKQAVSQIIRNQNNDHIPKLFIYTQIVLAINKNSATYATVGTDEKFWSKWKESKFEELKDLVDKPLEDKVCSVFDVTPKELQGKRLITEQDKALFSLCRPKRLLELALKFTVFDGGIKKIARYQQYFVVKSAITRVKKVYNNEEDKPFREGGMIWHTQGSGKSITMVMLARNLAFDPDILNPRIVLVTDRDDLDKQLGNTFFACGLEPRRAKSGKDIIKLISKEKSSIITTLIHKFETAYTTENYIIDESCDIFILADESHRTQFGSLSARMRQMFPYACYIGFTGTPLLKNEKNNFTKFGKLIEPNYPIKQAVEDGAVVPLLYEGRYVDITQNKKGIDLWFERHTKGLTHAQQADLKRKYARAEELNKADQVIYMRAFDITEHFCSNWQSTGFKAQLVAPDKASAIKYNDYLNEIGLVSSEVVISRPDIREGYEKTDDESKNKVVKFWQKMMKRYVSEEEYNKQIISNFKDKKDPEIIIVVDKLLTGFDAPKNTVLYLCRVLREHTLLQAVARVNRIYKGKDFGFIVDYANILDEMDKALTMYDELAGFDEADIEGSLKSINSEIEKLPIRHSALLDLFKTFKNLSDEEEYELMLADDELRKEFYDRVLEFGKTLSIALSSEKFLTQTDEKTLLKYKNDFRFFYKLRKSVQYRYAEIIDYQDYDFKIKKLLDTHIQANEVNRLNEPVNIFNNKIKDVQATYGNDERTKASQADRIAYSTKKSIMEKIDEDPAFYEKFSKLIQQVIDDFIAKRISDIQYLNKVLDIKYKVEQKVREDIPNKLLGNEDKIAYFGVIKPFIENQKLSEKEIESAAADTAIKIYDCFEKHKKVNFWDDEDAQKQVFNEIDDYFYEELKKTRGIELSSNQMDDIIKNVKKVAMCRSYLTS